MTKIVVDKVQVAQRQIDAAIRMLFANEDAIAIHTVLCAGFRILRDLVKHKKVDSPQLFEKIIRPEMKKEFWHLFNKPYNFFKHADKDPEDILDTVDEEINDFWLFLAIRYYDALGERLTTEMNAYQGWFMLSYPRFFPLLLLVDALKPFAVDEFQHMSRTERLEYGPLAIEAVRQQGDPSKKNG